MARRTEQRYVARVGTNAYHVVEFLTDAGGIALHGRPGALLLVNGQLVDSRDLARERGPVTIERDL